MSDYTLPPAYAFGLTQSRSLEDYGHAVAAPLLARIAELEAELSDWRQVRSAVAEIAGHDPNWPDHGNAPLAITASYALRKQESDRLRAEVEALRAKIDRAEVSYGNMLRADDKRPNGTTEYTRGWGDCLRAIAARKGEGSES